MKDKDIATALAFYLGITGVHRFYLGQAGYGVLYLFFCWTLIPAVISIVDAFVFWRMSQDQFDKEYNYEFYTRHHPQLSPAQELSLLGNLYQKGIISEEEFYHYKSRV